MAAERVEEENVCLVGFAIFRTIAFQEGVGCDLCIFETVVPLNEVLAHLLEVLCCLSESPRVD